MQVQNRININDPFNYYGVGDIISTYSIIDKKMTYYIIVSGWLEVSNLDIIKVKNLKVKKLDWELDRKDIIPIDDLKNKEYYYREIYKLTFIDDAIIKMNRNDLASLYRCYDAKDKKDGYDPRKEVNIYPFEDNKRKIRYFN